MFYWKKFKELYYLANSYFETPIFVCAGDDSITSGISLYNIAYLILLTHIENAVNFSGN